MTSNVKKHFFDDRQLRDLALSELTRAMRHGRLVAFTGAMTTEGLGYCSWYDLKDKIAKTARKITGQLKSPASVGREVGNILQRIDAHCRDLTSARPTVKDPRVHFSIIRDALGQIDAIHPISAPVGGGSRSDFDAEIAALFWRRQRKQFDGCDAVSPLLDNLGIRRFATLNYDFELERRIHLHSDERKEVENADSASTEPDQQATAEDKRAFERAFIAGGRATRDSIGRIHSARPDRISAESDVINRERPDRLFEFAVGSAEADFHVMHLHGRADMPERMVLDIRDYDRLYRRDDLHKRPFKHGLRMLHAGNPVLFVGLGMTETEINDMLQHFVSQSPYRRTSPAFLLWNTLRMSADQTERREEMALMRADFLQRLGIFVIFDDDFEPCRSEIEKLRRPALWYRPTAHAPTDRQIELSALATMLRCLPEVIAEIDGRSRRIGKHSREIVRGLSGRLSPRRLRLWGTTHLEAEAKKPKHLVAKISIDGEVSPGSKVQFFAAAPGTGRGFIAEWLYRDESTMRHKFGLKRNICQHRLLINAGFAYDADAILNGLRSFFVSIGSAESKGLCREEAISSGKLFAGAKARVILNGIDRFFGVDGAPLSAEIDLLLRSICLQKDSDVEWIILGTERLRHYTECLGQPIRIIRRERDEVGSNSASNDKPMIPSVYLSFVRDELLKNLGDNSSSLAVAGIGKMRFAADSLSRDIQRRAFFSAFLSPAVIEAALPSDQNFPALPFEILKALAFIGTPIEQHVLHHCIGIRQMFGAAKLTHAALHKMVNAMIGCGLVLKVEPFADQGFDRLTLHRTLVTEQREQRAVPLSEAMLSSSFNMSLFAAQPSGDYVPEATFHDELGSMVDRLIGAWHDVELSDKSSVMAALRRLDEPKKADASKIFPGLLSDQEEAIKRIAKLAHPESASCLRAALSIIRGYFSTSSLLQLDCGDRLVSPTRDGALSEHADRLDRLLTGFGTLATARDFVREIVAGSNVATAIAEEMGPEPFYMDDIVWLHNERGVVKQTQGDLYAAHRSYRLAASVNKDEVERGYHGHNWRRITINVVGVLIERGRMTTALELLDEIEQTINRGDCRNRHRPESVVIRPMRHFDILIDRFGTQEGYVDSCLDGEFTREEILMASLVLGYRGLIAQNQGRERDAAGLYVRAISIARRLGEKRTYALFQRHYATLRSFSVDSSKWQRVEDLAVATADACAHRDMSYRARLLGAKSIVRKPSMTNAERRNARRYIQQALTYAEHTDTHRVRIEALAALSRMMLDDGEMEGALSATCDAMALACRYGDVLHKISLRVQLGEILMHRGDPKSGQALLDRAGKLASRIGYFRIMERINRIESRQF